MHALRELQRGVMRALLGDGPGHAGLATGDTIAGVDATAGVDPVAAHIIAPHGISPVLALGVYANNARTNFIDSLMSSFPATLRLVGVDYFRQCARSFHALHPSRSGDLQPAGTEFPRHLSILHGADQYRYLGDVARLEWLIQETLLAGDAGPFELAKLGQVAPSAYDDLMFRLHPSVRLFTAAFPCVRIWEANTGGDTEPETINLDGGSDRVLLIRDQGRLRFHSLSAAELGFLQSIQAGERLCAAIDSGTRAADASGFDAAEALRRFVSARVIIDFQ